MLTAAVAAGTTVAVAKATKSWSPKNTAPTGKASSTTRKASAGKGTNNNSNKDQHNVPLGGADDSTSIEHDYKEEDRGLLNLRRQRIRRDDDEEAPNEWMRPYWLGAGLFLVLLTFWILDTLKDPIFAVLVGGDLERHQPTAKLFSVCWTLVLVCFLEYVSNERKRRAHLMKVQKRISDDDVLDGGGQWTRMKTSSATFAHEHDPIDLCEEEEDRVSSSIFLSIGVPYFIGFGIIAYLLQFNPSVAIVNPSSSPEMESFVQEFHLNQQYRLDSKNAARMWQVMGYFLYAGIESFGSIAVATFWSFTNSTLSLHDAERYYGLIIALAQLGAIAGSTIVTTHIWSNVTLIVLACLVILLQILVMLAYDRRFPPTSNMVGSSEHEETLIEKEHPKTQSLWSGVYLILRHNYVLLILGASCLYEVSLTCLNYQMTLLGWRRFENETDHGGMTFTQFMGHYGQMVNASSLILSSIVFPFLIRRIGLRITIRLFPSLLIFANILAFIAMPGRLWNLFVSLSILKAMSYSIHDPSKEILYIPTSNGIKFKAKFWIDVVMARMSKAIGSLINNMAGSVDRSIRVASAPSLLTAAALWVVCYQAGKHFERLIETGTVVGVDDVETEDERPCIINEEVIEDDEEGNVHGEDSDDDSGILEDPTAASALDPLRESNESK